MRYDVNSDILTYGCTSYIVTSYIGDNTTQASSICVSDYHGFYADDTCEYCCLGNLCNRDQTSSWVKIDCSRLRGSAATVTMATVAVAVAAMTSSWFTM